MRSVKIGSNVDAWCTRCKLVLAHTVEASVGSSIKRVACNTCHGKHQFKAGPPGSNVSSLGRTRVMPVKASAQWKHQDPSLATAYIFSGRYAPGALLNHTQFGVGLVTADKGGNKIEVLFEAGSKVLIHGR